MKVAWCIAVAVSLLSLGSAGAAEPAAPQKVKLGDPSLTAGIPGKGKLTLAEVEAWLAKAENHQPLEFELPQGLAAAGAHEIKVPKDNPLTRAKIELGRQLFFDPRLSADGTVSCASCHDPDFGYGKDTQFGVGIRGQEGNRNSPIAYNRILSDLQFWDGRAASLEEQAKGPIANPIEMGHTHEACLASLAKVPAYKAQFDKIFPKEGLNIDTVAKAIASFERVLVTGTSPADAYEPLRAIEKAYAELIADPDVFAEEDPDAFKQYQAAKKASAALPISESAKRGREIFFTEKGGCTACHGGANFTDEKYHNLGIGMDKKEPDLGRYAQTKDEKDRGAFKTPTVRNVELTAPYMHDGSLKTLEDVVEWYAKGGHPNPHLSDKVRKLDLSPQDKKDLVAYMKALTGPLPKVEKGRLP